MVNAKSPNKKRKSLANVVSPKDGVKTPGQKNKNNATPGKPNKTPKPTPQKNNFVKAPKATPPKAQEQNSVKKGGKKKRSSESESETPPKKLKMFSGTTELEGSKTNESKPKEKKVKRKGQFHHLKEKINSGDKAAIEELESKIKAFEGRKELTKTAKRKLRMLTRLKDVASGKKPAAPLTTSKKRRERKKEAKGKKQPTEEQQKSIQKGNKKAEKQKVVQAQEEESDDESSDYEVETEVKPDKIIKTKSDSDEEEEESDEDEEAEEEESGDDVEVEEESGDEEESVEEEEDENEDEEEDDSDEESPKEVEVAKNKQGKKPQPKQVEAPNLQELKDNKIVSKDQKRYVLFVGNLPFDATKQEIAEHFKKAGQVRHIRIPNDKQTNKPRGFAYVEFDNEVAYQKGLSLHHTSIKGRRINVLYTQGGKKKGDEKKKEVKVKNLKLQAMRKQGQLAGSVKENQKRSARRAKKNQAKTSINGS